MRALRDSAGLRLGLALAALTLAAPFLLGDNRYLGFVLGMTLINVLWAAGMNLAYGYVGLMPLMFSGVGGIAAYAMVHLTRVEGWSFWLATPVASLGAACAGVLLGLPSLRLKGFYFTLCSLVIQTVLTLAFIFFPKYTNGDTGISQIAPPAWFGGELHGAAFEFVLALAAALGVAIVALIVPSRLGRRFIAIREDDVLAEAVGIGVTRYKILAFVIVSLYASVGSCFYATYVGFVSPRAFDVLGSLNVWLMVAFGGRGTVIGPVIGALILAPIPYLLQDLQALRDILYGALIIVVILVLPGGIYGEILRRRAGRAGAQGDAARLADQRA